MKLSDFKMNMLNRYCRKCINKELSIDLQTKDCVYAIYPNKCQGCGEMRNIVENIHWGAQGKVLFASQK